MPPPIVSETPELFLEMDALKIIQRWAGHLTRVVQVTTAYKGVQCEIRIQPTMIPMIDVDVKMTPCESDVLSVLQAAGRRLTHAEICEQLEVAKHYHGSRTVSDALGALAERGLIVRPRVGTRDGYGIKE